MATVSHQSANSIFPGNQFPALPTPLQYPAASSLGFRPSTHAVNPYHQAGRVAVPAYPVSAGVRLVNPAPPAARAAPRYDDSVRYPPIPYEFDYAVNAVDGSHSRQERGDAAGRVTGSYSIQLADGRNRVVEYVADEAGYRANIRTNEFGTESQSPADVVLQSSAIPAKEAALLGERDPAFRQYGPAHHKA